MLNSNIQKEEIDLALKNSEYYATEETNSWKLLYNYYNLDDNKFEKLTNEIYFKIYNLEYKILKEVKMVASILLSFKEKNLINKNDFCLEYETKKQINYLFDNNLIDDETILPIKKLESNSYENYEFMESNKMNEINEYIDDKLKIKLEEKLKRDSGLVIKAILDNKVDDLNSLLIYTTNKYVPYDDKPILKYLSIDELINTLKNSDNRTIRKFFHILDKRYDFNNNELIDEKEFLNKLKTKLEILSLERNGQLSGYYFRDFSNNLLKNIKKLGK